VEHLLIIAFNLLDILVMDKAELIGSLEIHGDQIGENQVIFGFQLDKIFAELEMKQQLLP